MKTAKILMTAALMTMMAVSVPVLAQQGKGQMMVQKEVRMERNDCKLPDLTDEQKTKIEALRVSHLKEMQTLRNQMGELKAKARTMATADKYDEKAVNANIDEMSKLQNLMMKKKSAHRNAVRSLLTDSQKVIFDAQSGKGYGKGKGMHQNCGAGQMCNGQGMKSRGK
jgi:Spy/CpxP family protein refolding chaperone